MKNSLSKIFIISLIIVSPLAIWAAQTEIIIEYPTAPDTTPPVISGVTATNIASTSATIIWTTDEPATSQVNYGLTTSYGATTTLSSTLVTSHSQLITGLSPSTGYNYRVRSRDGSGNEAVSGNYTFTTVSGLPSISNVRFVVDLEGDPNEDDNEFTITIYQLGTQLQLAQPVNQQRPVSGAFLLTTISLAGGQYDVLVSSRYYLSKKQTSAPLFSEQTINLPGLPSGDLDGNNSVNALDWSIMSPRWFTSSSDRPEVDINKDGQVNTLDWSFMNRNWFTAGD